MREMSSKAGAGQLTYGNFTGIVTTYESESGLDLPGMYRDDRGSIYHPHIREEPISLGQQVARAIFLQPGPTIRFSSLKKKDSFRSSEMNNGLRNAIVR